MSEPVTLLSATAQSEMINTGELSAREMVTAHLTQIEEQNPKINAICTISAESALAKAAELDQLSAKGHSAGPLHGLVIAIKDVHFTKGIRTTFGSPIYRDLVPNQSHLHVEMIEHAGGIVIGKTNVPEFAAGSQTYNEIFGATKNPYDLTKTVGGSSGGAAAALATGMSSLADGSDMGGSLRNPASFCNVFGLRPTPGRVPVYPSKDPWNTLSVIGPMARTAKDLGLLFSVMAQWNKRDPLSIKESSTIYHPANWVSSLNSQKIAASLDLSEFPLQPAVKSLFENTIGKLSSSGLSIDWDQPNLKGADEVFRTLRGYSFAGSFETEYAKSKDLLNPAIVWNIEQGMELTALDLYRARVNQGEIFQRMLDFFENYDFLMLPTVQVLPFSVELKFPDEIDGRKSTTYIDWMASCYLLSVTQLPVIAVPVGFSDSGLPFGIQIATKPGGELDLLVLADKIDEILGASKTRPGSL